MNDLHENTSYNTLKKHQLKILLMILNDFCPLAGMRQVNFLNIKDMFYLNLFCISEKNVMKFATNTVVVLESGKITEL